MDKRYDLVDCDAIRSLVRRFELDASGTNRNRIDRLEEHFKHTASEGADGLQCDRCGFISDSGFDVCPFCQADDLHPFSTVKEGVQQKTLYFEDDLGEILLRIERMVAGLKNYYRIGQMLAEVHRKELFKLRRRSTGAQIYPSFAAWVEGETPFESLAATRLIRIAETVTIGDWEKRLGPNVMGFIEKHLFQRKFGRSLFNKPKRDYEPVLRYTEDQGHAIEIKAPEPDDDHVTTRLEQEDGTVEKTRIPKHLIRRPSTYRAKPIDPRHAMERVDLEVGFNQYPMKKRTKQDEAARSIDDDPWAEIPLSGTVSMIIRIVRNSAGKLSLLCNVQKKEA